MEAAQTVKDMVPCVMSLEQEIEDDALKSSWSRDFFAKNVTEVCVCVRMYLLRLESMEIISKTH